MNQSKQHKHTFTKNERQAEREEKRKDTEIHTIRVKYSLLHASNEITNVCIYIIIMKLYYTSKYNNSKR